MKILALKHNRSSKEIFDIFSWSDTVCRLNGANQKEQLLERLMPATIISYLQDFSLVLLDCSDYDLACDFYNNYLKNSSIYICGFFKDEDFSKKQTLLGKNFVAFRISDRESYGPIIELIINKVLKEDYNSNLLEMLTLYLDSSMHQAVTDFQRVKSIHKALIPVRKQDFKNIKVYGKFLAGSGDKSEFFDVQKVENNLYYILVSSKSHLLMADIIGLVSELSDEIKNRTDFFDILLNDLYALNEKHELGGELEILFFSLDLIRLNLDGVLFGNHVVSSNKFILTGNDLSFAKHNQKIASFSLKLQHKDRFFIVSSGLKSNSSGMVDGVTLEKFLNNKIDTDPTEVIHEVFYYLRNGDLNITFSRDSSLNIFEVSKNAIIQV